jgi:glycosyltransferase involved in cell wall biosynthesis
MADIVDGHNGLCFAANDAQDLVAKVQYLYSDPSVLKGMRRAARATFERKFTAESNLKALMAIYARAVKEHSGVV